jgi:dihydrofolate synthase/folylpolyglutamate synthase
MPADAHYIFTRADMPRAAKTEVLADVARTLGLDFECRESVAEAVEAAKAILSADDMLFIGGSTFVVAEALSLPQE